MWQKIKLLILKIIFSPLWLIACFVYWLTKAVCLAFNIWYAKDDKNIWKYWRF